MSGKPKIGAVISLDGEKEFKQAVSNATKELTNLKSETNLVKTQFDGQANTMEALKAKYQNLNKVLDAQKQKQEAVKSALDHSKQSYDKVGTGLEKLKSQYDTAKQKLDQMKTAGSASEKEMQVQEKAVKELSDAIKKGEINYQTASDRIKKWETDLNNANAAIIKTEKELQQNNGYMKEAGRATDGCASSIDEFGKKTKTASEKVSNSTDALETLATVIIANGVNEKINDIANALLDCSNAAGAFETSMAQVSTIINENTTSLASAKDQILSLSTDTGEAAGNLAEISYNAISSGVDAAHSIDAAEKSTKLATAGFTNSSAALSVLTTSMNSYKMGAEEMENISDSLIVTQNLGVLTVDKLSNSIGKGISSASAYNVDLYNLESGYISLTKAGISVEESTTYMSGMFNELGKSGTKVAGIIKDSTGKSFGQLMQEGNTLGDVLKILYENVDGNSEALMNLWSSQEAGKASNAIVNQGLEEFNQNLDAVKNSAGATDEAYKKMANTSEFAEKKMKNSLKNLEIAIGDQLNPALVECYEVGGDAFDWAADFVKTNPGMISAIAGLTAALKFFAVGITAMLILPKVTKAVKEFTAALTLNPVFLMVTALVAVVTAVTSYGAAIDNANDKSKEFRQGVEEQIQASKDLVRASKESENSVNEEWLAHQKLTDELFRLNSSQEETTDKKNKMKAIVDVLAKDIPELAEAYSEETGALKLTREEMDKIINKRKEYALSVAAQENMQEVAGQIAKNELAVEKATQKLEQAKARYQKATGENYNYSETVTYADSFSTMSTEKECMELTENIKELKVRNKELNNEFEIAAESTANYDDALNGAKDGTEGMTAAQVAAAQSTAELTEEQIKAYEELKSSIESSIDSTLSAFDAFDGGTEVATEKILENLTSQVDGIKQWSENMKTLAGAAGDGMSKEFYDYLIEMGPRGANMVQSLADSLENDKDKFSQVCSKWTEAMDLESAVTESIASADTALAIGTQIMANTASQGAENVNTCLENTGNVDIYSNLQNAFNQATVAARDGSNNISEATRKAFSEAVSAAREKGAEIPQGLAEGIASGQINPQDAVKQLNNAITQQQGEATEQAKQSGTGLTQAQAEGITAGSQGVADAAASTARQASAAAGNLASDFYATGGYLMSGMQSGIIAKTQDIADAAAATVRAALEAAKKEADIHSPSKKFKDEVGKQIAKGVAFGIKENADAAGDEAEKLSKKTLTAATKWIDKKKKKQSVSLNDEIYYWEQVKSKLNSGTKAYEKAEKKIQSLKAKQDYNLGGSALDAYKTYYKVSAKAEADYWNTIRKQYKEGSAERLEADQKYFEAKESYNSQLESLNEEYYENCKDTNEKLADDVKDLTDTYNNAVSERKKTIYDSFGLFDQFESKSKSGITLLNNLKSQVAGYADWELQIENLSGRGISKGLLDELKEMGPEASASLHALNSLTAEQLAQYDGLWQQKNALAESQAVKDTEVLKTETERKIQEIQNAAQQQLDAYRASYEKTAAELSASMEAPLKKIAKKASTWGEETILNYIKQSKKIATSKDTKADLKEVNSAITSQMKELPSVGAKIGKNTLEGILDGLTNKKKINASAKEMVDAIKKAVQDAADIHSPSRLFRKEIGNQLGAGVELGLRDKIKGVSMAGSDMISYLLEEQQKKISAQQLYLKDFTGKIIQSHPTTEAEAKVSTAAEVQNIINVSNKTVSDQLTVMMEMLSTYLPEIANAKIVMDTGEVVGIMSNGIGNELAMAYQRRRR